MRQDLNFAAAAARDGRLSLFFHARFCADADAFVRAGGRVLFGDAVVGQPACGAFDWAAALRRRTVVADAYCAAANGTRRAKTR